MKVGKIHVEFKHKLQGYKHMNEVPFWKLYMVKVTRKKETFTDYIGKLHTMNHKISQVLCCTPTAITMDELGDLCEMLEPCKNTIFVAYPRKYRLDGRNPANRRSK